MSAATLKLPRRLSALLLFAALTPLHAVETLHFSSPPHQVTLIELYTSEGCSSCPPAERWLNSLKTSPKLWQEIVPVAFHVDYWNYLGWEDRFADPRFAKRQYRARQLGHVRSVYTPGMMKNGREWRGWRWGQSAVSGQPESIGILTAQLQAKQLQVEFQPQQQIDTPLQLNVAWLGNNIKSPIRAGENRGKQLEHEFVVLDWQQQLTQGKPYQWQLTQATSRSGDPIHALAIWVSRVNDPTPIQATGGWIGEQN